MATTRQQEVEEAMKTTGIFILAVFIIPLTMARAGATSFQAATTISTAPYAPSAASFADFNGDGHQDLALPVSNGTNHYLRIQSGDGTGSFSFSSDLATPSLVGSIVAADLNGDGVIDLAVSNTTTGSISIFICNGNGTFQNRTDYAVGTAPKAIAVGDFKGDGVKDDIAVVNSTANSVAILLNDGSGVLTATNSGTWPTASDSLVGLAVGDFDGNSSDDIAVARNGVGKAQLFFANGIGTFSTGGSEVAVGAGPNALAAADLNNDGISDLAVVNGSDATVSIIPGRRGSPLSVSSTYAVTTPADNTANPLAITVADLNRDGIMDIAVANGTKESLSVLNGKGDTTFTSAESFATGSAPTAMAWGDLNGSGNELISVSSTNSTYSVLLNSSPAAAGLSVLPGSYDFGKFQIGHYTYLGKLLTLVNNGSASLTITSTTTSGADSADFQATTQDSASCNSITPTIPAGSSCTILAKFMEPFPAGVKTASLNLASNAAIVPTVTVPLAGTGIESSTPYSITISFIGLGSGSVSFSSGDAPCTTDCSRTPAETLLIALASTPASGSYLHGWTGCDSIYSGACQIKFDFANQFDRNLTVNFGLVTRRFMVAATPPTYTTNLLDAYSAAGNNEAIRLPAGLLDESLTMNRNIVVSLLGGYDSGFTAQGSPTVLHALIVAAGSAIIDNIVLQ